MKMACLDGQVYTFLSFSGLPIVPGCDLSRNSFVLLPYEDKDCCEETYLTDHSGCLIGGQFNGRPGHELSITTERVRESESE